MNNKFVKIVSVALIVILGGCGLLENKNTREYMEKHFSYLEKVYPTKNVGELFEKFPNGVKIKYTIAMKKNDNSVDSSYFDFVVNSKQKRIYGTERKLNISSTTTTEIYKEEVEYVDGEIVYLNNKNLSNQKILFLFEQINYKDLNSLEFRRARYDYQQPSYSIHYRLSPKMYEVTKNIDQDMYLDISDYGRQEAKVEMGTYDFGYSILEQFVGETDE